MGEFVEEVPGRIPTEILNNPLGEIPEETSIEAPKKSLRDIMVGILKNISSRNRVQKLGIMSGLHV